LIICLGENWSETPFQTRNGTKTNSQKYQAKTTQSKLKHIDQRKPIDENVNTEVDLNNNNAVIADSMVPTNVKSLTRNLKSACGVPSLSAEQSIDESSSISNESETDETQSNEETIHSANNSTSMLQQPMQQPVYTELSCNTSGVYTTECEFNNTAAVATTTTNGMVLQHQHLIPPQQGSPYYVYQQSPYQQSGYYYQTYSPYAVYDPSVASPAATTYQTYSPSQATLGSPCQQGTANLTSYHTPQQASTHQLYISPNSCISPSSDSTAPHSGSASSTSNQTTESNAVGTSVCNSPPHSQSVASFVSQSGASSAQAPAYYTTQQQQGQYMVYSQTPTQSSYMSPQQIFQSPLPTSTSPYLMYQQQHVMNAPGLMSPCQSTPSTMHHMTM
jgi:hypothetical protein